VRCQKRPAPGKHKDVRARVGGALVAENVSFRKLHTPTPSCFVQSCF